MISTKCLLVCCDSETRTSETRFIHSLSAGPYYLPLVWKVLLLHQRNKSIKISVPSVIIMQKSWSFCYLTEHLLGRNRVCLVVCFLFSLPFQSPRRVSCTITVSSAAISCRNTAWTLEEDGVISALNFLWVSAVCPSQKKSIACTFQAGTVWGHRKWIVKCYGTATSLWFHLSSIQVCSAYGNICHAQQGLLVFPAAWGRSTYQHEHNSEAYAVYNRANPQYTECTKSTWFNKTCDCCSNMSRRRLVPKGWTDRFHSLYICI